MRSYDEPSAVRTVSGICALCDHRFIREAVRVIADDAVPGGYAYIELRHLLALDSEPERPDDTAQALGAGDR